MSDPGSTTSTAERGRQADRVEELRAEIARAQRLDRDLAGDLGRDAPARSSVGGAYIDALGRRPPLSEIAVSRFI